MIRPSDTHITRNINNYEWNILPFELIHMSWPRHIFVLL